MRLRVETDGTIKAVYSDKIKNMNLGRMQVIRASNVEFNETSQEWEAKTPTGELIAHGPNRDKVIEEEVRVIEARL
jgi:hypothetical protein